MARYWKITRTIAPGEQAPAMSAQLQARVEEALAERLVPAIEKALGRMMREPAIRQIEKAAPLPSLGESLGARDAGPDRVAVIYEQNGVEIACLRRDEAIEKLAPDADGLGRMLIDAHRARKARERRSR